SAELGLGAVGRARRYSYRSFAAGRTPISNDQPPPASPRSRRNERAHEPALLQLHPRQHPRCEEDRGEDRFVLADRPRWPHGPGQDRRDRRGPGKRMARDSDLILVSSGAVASGMGPLGLSTRPTDLATKQAAAAVGQVRLAQEWSRSFARFGRTTAQVLLTSADAGDRPRARTAQRTIDRLRQMGGIPIVNENDTVAASEMRFGDNDRLAALVSHLAFCDALVLLSDVDGLYDRNPSEPGAQ